MAYKVAYFSIRKPDDFIVKNDKEYYDDEDYDPNEFPNNGVTRARVNENIAYAALGVTVFLCFFVLGLLCFMLRTKYMKDSSGCDESRTGKSWSRMFEKEPKQTQEAKRPNSMLVSYGRSMPSLPTSTSHCNLHDDTLSCSNLSAGLTGFQELPVLLNYTRRNRNRMNRELSYAIASAKSKVNLSEIHGTLAREGITLPPDEDANFQDSPYEVVVDIKTPL